MTGPASALEAAESYCEGVYGKDAEGCHPRGCADFLAGAAWAFERAAQVAEDCGTTNVENPAIDMFERMRRQGIRWCGEWVAQRVRALAGGGNVADTSEAGNVT